MEVCCTWLQNNIPWHTTGIKLLQQQWINGRGSVQAVNGDCCMHIHTRNKGCGSLCTCSQQISLWKVSVAHDKRMLQWHPSLHFHIMLFLILHLMWSNLGQTQIEFKVGTQMTGMIRVTRPGLNADFVCVCVCPNFNVMINSKHILNNY